MIIAPARSGDSAYLDAISWAPPHVETGWLFEAARFYVRGLTAEMLEMTRLARADSNDPFVRRTSLILEGIGLGLSGEFTAAAERFIESQGLFRSDPVLQLNIGVLLVKTGHLQKAAESFQLTVQIDPDNGMAWSYLAIVSLLSRDWSRAGEAAWEALRRTSPIPEVVQLCLLNACVATGRPIDEAVGFPAPPAEAREARPDRCGLAEIGRQTPDDGPVVFVAVLADDLPDLEPMIWSLKAAQADCSVHLHVVNPTAETRRDLDRLTSRSAPLQVRWSSENLIARDSRELRRLLQTFRFTRLRDFLRGYRAPVILADGDVLFRDAPGQWILPSPERPVRLIHTPDARVEAQFSGRLAAFYPGPRTNDFLEEAIRASGAELIRNGRGDELDQLALWGACYGASDQDRSQLLSWQVTGPGAAEGAGSGSAPGSETGPDACARFAAELAAAYATPAEAPAVEPPPNELVQSKFGPMLVNRYDIHIAPAMRVKGGGEVVEEIDLLRRFVGPGDVALDVGANIGTHTVPLCQLVGPLGKVFAFEPQRVIYQIMVANVALNSCLNAHCHQAAVGARRGRLRVPGIDYNRPSNFGMVSFQWDTGPKASGELPDEEVELLTIDGLKLSACALIKIDVEGMEGDVLEGARRTIRKHRPVIYMECFESDLGRAAIAKAKAEDYRVFQHRTIGGHNVLCIPIGSPWATLGMTEV